MDGTTWNDIVRDLTIAVIGLLLPSLGIVVRATADYLRGRLELALEIRRQKMGLSSSASSMLPAAGVNAAGAPALSSGQSLPTDETSARAVQTPGNLT